MNILFYNVSILNIHSLIAIQLEQNLKNKQKYQIIINNFEIINMFPIYLNQTQIVFFSMEINYQSNMYFSHILLQNFSIRNAILISIQSINKNEFKELVNTTFCFFNEIHINLIEIDGKFNIFSFF